LPTSYPVTGGEIGNGTVIFTFHVPSGATVTCTYVGGASSASPSTADDLNLGRTLNFQSCSDGLPASTKRTGDDFSLQVNGVPGFPVDVGSPAIVDGACSDELQLLTPVQTQQMRESFTWSGKTSVATTNSDGTPTLYYAWVLLKTETDALNLRKLFIHVLGRPLFNQELDAFAGRCGPFTNPGDGTGVFVPVLIPGVTYNKLLAAISSPDISGDKTVFDAIILRNNDVPTGARNSNGSVRLDILGQSGFRYLEYEPRPLDPNSITMDGGRVRKALVAALDWIVDAAKNGAQAITNTVANIDKLIRGKATVTLQMHVINPDSAFTNVSGVIQIRGWGPYRGHPLGAPGLEVSILQKTDVIPIPETSQGLTDMDGNVTIEAVDDATIRGSGACIELKNDAARMTNLFNAFDVCDLRSYSGDARFRLNIKDGATTEIKIGSQHLIGFYQADDSYQWDATVAGLKPPRARILTGYWAELFSQRGNGKYKRAYTPCLDMGGGLTDELLATAMGADGLLGVVTAGVPGIAAAIVDAFVAVLTQADIVMPPQAGVGTSRLIMSHEYGHYILCDLLNTAPNRDGQIGTFIKQAIKYQNDIRIPARALNEAFADFVSAQVTSGVNYGFLKTHFPTTADGFDNFCAQFPSSEPCVDENLRGVATSSSPENDPSSIGRYMTLLQDMFDGHPYINGKPDPRAPTSADAWDQVDKDGMPLTLADDYLVSSTYTPGPMNSPWGDFDTGFDHIALAGHAIKDFGDKICDLTPSGTEIDDLMVYQAAAMTMANFDQNWCDLCELLALHAHGSDIPLGDDPTVTQILQTCINSPHIRPALDMTQIQPPDPFGNISILDCTACPQGQFSDDGVCKICPGTVHGNKCDACPVDVPLDGNTMNISAGTVVNGATSVAGDICPDVLVIELDNPQGIAARGGVLRTAFDPAPPISVTNCDELYQFQVQRTTGGGVFTTTDTPSGTGTATCANHACTACDGTPTRTFPASDVADKNPIRFVMNADPLRQFEFNTAQDIPH